MIEVKEIKEKEIWERFVLNHPDGNFLQSWYWGEVNKGLGHKVFPLGFFYQSQLKGACLLIKKQAKRGAYLESPAGPLIDWSKLFFKKFVDQLKKIGRQEKCLFARVRPQIEDNLSNRIVFKNNGFISSPMHLHAETTWQLNLKKSQDQLLKEMRKTTRYLIKKGEKIGVKVNQSSNIKDVDVLYKLQMETVKRHHFVPFPKENFLQEFKAFSSDDRLRIFKAVWKKQVLSIAFIIFYGREAVYHYSASSSNFPKIPAAYALQWQAICEAKKLGCHYYNFWGIAPTENQQHRFYGVSLFKKGFGGFSKSWLPAQDLPLGMSYWPIFIFEKARKVYRHL